MQKTLYNKKGQVQGTVSTVIALIVGVGVSVMILIFVGALGGNTFNLVEGDIDAIGDNDIVNESITVINGSAVSLNHGFIDSSTVTVYNGTGAVTISGNLTIDYAEGTITLISNWYNNTALTVDYNWGNDTVREYIFNGILSSFEAMEQTGDYLPIIVLAVVISLVLALVLGFTMMGGKSGGGNAL